MATTTEEIVTRYSADDRYSAVVGRIANNTKRFGNVVEQVQRKASRRQGAAIFGDLDDLSTKIGGITGAFGQLGIVADTLIAPIKAVGFAILGVTGVAATGAGAFAGFARSALDAHAEMDSLKRGLTAISGSAEQAAMQFEVLSDVAKLPGLGNVEDVVASALRLQASGSSFNMATRTIIELGNALASVGKGQAELDGVVMALTQIQSKGVVSAEEINQLAERLPQIRRLMQGAFGTSNTEQLQKLGITAEVFIGKIVEQMAKLDRTSGGVRNTLDNLQASIKAGMADAGEAVEENFLPALTKVTTMVENMASNGAFKNITDQWAKLFGGGNEDFFVTAASYVFAVAQALPSLIDTAVKTAKEGIQWIYDRVKAIVQVAATVTGVGGVVSNLIRDIESTFTGAEGSSAMGLNMILERIESAAQGFRELANKPAELPVPPALEEIAKQNSPLFKIEQNTRSSADSLTRQEKLYERVLGGGGRSPVSAVEMASIRRGRGSKIEQAIRDMANTFYFMGQEAAVNQLIVDRRPGR